MEKVIGEILKFGDSVLEKGEGLSKSVRSDLTTKYGVYLPKEYYMIMQVMNGFCVMGDCVAGIKDESLFGVSIEDLYYREHFEVGNPMFKYLVPFSNDGGGSHYCFDTRGVSEGTLSGKVVFWQWDYSYSEDDEPEITHDSLSEWISEVLIEWTLEDYDYNGNEK